MDFLSLVAYRDINTKEIANAAFSENILYPPLIYKDASKEIEDQLIDRIVTPDCESAGDVLSCLSFIGSNRVVEVFQDLEQNPLPWRMNLYVGPSFYAQQAGWTLREGKGRVELTFETCYALQEQETMNPGVLVGVAHNRQCSVCSCETVDILCIEASDPRLEFLGLHGHIKLPICPNCASLCERTIIRYQINKGSSFEVINPMVDENYLTKEDLKHLTHNNLGLSLKPKPYYFGYGVDSELSIIGGNPYWIQDTQYENCPDCQNAMKSLASIAWNQIMKGSEGTLYMQICTDCSVVVCVFQQT